MPYRRTIVVLKGQNHEQAKDLKLLFLVDANNQEALYLDDDLCINLLIPHISTNRHLKAKFTF